MRNIYTQHKALGGWDISCAGTTRAILFDRHKLPEGRGALLGIIVWSSICDPNNRRLHEQSVREKSRVCKSGISGQFHRGVLKGAITIFDIARAKR